MKPTTQLLACLLLSLGMTYSAFAKPRVVTTTTMVTDLVKTIGGDAIEVQGLMGPGVDPHLYRPTAGQLNTLRRADIIFYNGLHLEGRVIEILQRLGKRGQTVHAVAGAVPVDLLLDDEDYPNQFDPHIWFDPRLWAMTVDGMVGVLSAQVPDQADRFAARGEAYKAELEALNEWSRARLGTIPEAKRVLVTSHDAFNYFGRAYDFEVVALQGLSTTSEAGLAEISALADFLKEREIKALFIESSVMPAPLQRVARQANVKIGGELFSDAMGEPGQIETGPDGSRYDVGTYDGMIRHNINTIVEGLK
jgi:manganese/zinc/iron transport system substrate-binding protein